MDTYTLYLSAKALHLIAMVCWFAGLFYLPRLFVYHVENPEAGPTLAVMERKLMAYIMRPAALATFVFGFTMVAVTPEVMQMGWLHAKLTLVFLLVAYHGLLEGHLARFQRGANRKSSRYFRLFNEIPTVLLIAIVFLAVLKPF